MDKFIALEPVKHDGKRYEPGESLTLKADEAKALLASGAIEHEVERKSAKKADGKAD